MTSVREMTAGTRGPIHAAYTRVAVVIVNFRTPSMTIDCIRSLEGSVGVRLDIIVVDNDSRDDSAGRIQDACPDARLIRAPSNGGYTQGNNLGIEAALEEDVDYVLVLNPDTVSINGHFIHDLADFLDGHHSVGAVGPKVYLRERGQVQNTILRYPWLHRRFISRISQVLFGSPLRSGDQPRRAEVLNGVCVLFRADALREVGLFDERTFAYIEDIEWASRADRHGWERWYLPVESIIHCQKQSGYELGSNVDFLLKRNTLYFLLKTRHWIQALGYTVATAFQSVVRQARGKHRDRRFLHRLARSYVALWLGRFDEAMGRPEP